MIDSEGTKETIADVLIDFGEFSTRRLSLTPLLCWAWWSYAESTERRCQNTSEDGTPSSLSMRDVIGITRRA